MHKVSAVAEAIIGLYSDADDEHRRTALSNINDPEIQGILAHYKIKGRGDLERIKNSRSLALTTREMRVIARRIKQLDLNRNMTPAQFRLLDPHGTHTMSMLFRHRQAKEKDTDIEHVRFHAYLKLIGKQNAVEPLMDVPMEFIRDYYTDEEIPENPYDEHVKRAEGKS